MLRRITLGTALFLSASALASAYTITSTFTIPTFSDVADATFSIPTFKDVNIQTLVNGTAACQAPYHCDVVLNSVTLSTVISENYTVQGTNGSNRPKSITGASVTGDVILYSTADAYLDFFGNPVYATVLEAVDIIPVPAFYIGAGQTQTKNITYTSNKTTAVTTAIGVSSYLDFRQFYAGANNTTIGIGTIPTFNSSSLQASTLTGTASGTGTVVYDYSVISSTPEPASLVLFGSALVGLGLLRKRTRS
jgi:hypothetical protein